MRSVELVVTMFGIVLLAGSTFGQDKKISRAELPAAVQKTVDSASRGATVRGFSKESEKGRTYYEAELTSNGHSRDILIDSSGKLVEIEEEVAFDSLPASVKQGLQAKVGSGKIGKVETLTKHGKLVAYEAQVITGTKKSEIQVGPDGKSLSHEE